MDIDAFITELALREEWTFFFGVIEGALLICQVTIRPMTALNLLLLLFTCLTQKSLIIPHSYVVLMRVQVYHSHCIRFLTLLRVSMLYSFEPFLNVILFSFQNRAFRISIGAGPLLQESVEDIQFLRLILFFIF